MPRYGQAVSATLGQRQLARIGAWLEAIFMSGMFGFVGLGAVFFPFALRGLEKRDRPTMWQRLVAITLGLSGLGFLLFGALNFFTHVGLIINTMGPMG